MNEATRQSEPIKSVTEYEDEIDLLELVKTIWKGKKLIIGIVLICTIGMAVMSLFMTNVYTAKAVLKPTSQTQGGAKLSALASQFGGLASLAGIAMPSSASSTEMVTLLRSNILKKEIIENYQLLPILFHDQWDGEKKAWKKSGISLNPLTLISGLLPARQGISKKKPGPDTWDGIRALNGIVNVNYNMKEDIITISVNFRDPDIAAQIANYFIVALNDHMSLEAKRVAIINREYLEKQLTETNDPIVQQKIYNLIADKIETMMMAEVKEGFAFKVLDPPMAPDKKSAPKRAQMVIVAFMVSLFFSVFVVLLREYIKKIKATSAGGHHAK
jgi:uncharacterized protein involved in exopolysaccharide biosynthesis